MKLKNLFDWMTEQSFFAYCTAKLDEFIKYIETYVFADWQFLNFLTVLLIINSILGIYTHYKTQSIRLNLFTFWFQKILIYTCFLVLVHILSNFTVAGEKNQFFGWINSVGYSALILRESIFILENMGAIRSGLIPGWILKKLKKYHREGFQSFQQENNK